MGIGVYINCIYRELSHKRKSNKVRLKNHTTYMLYLKRHL